MTEYWYAWRGGPQILRATAKSDILLERELARLAPAALAKAAEADDPNDDKFLYGLITRYLESPDFQGAAERTRRDRRKFLDRARAELGDLELRALRAEGAKRVFLDWRDRYAKTPKTADELLNALSIALAWGLEEDLCKANPIASFKRIYHANRAEVIWEPQHLAALLPHCPLELGHAVRLAVLCGARMGDLRRLTWGAVGEAALKWETGKSNNRRTVVAPITPDLRALLNEIPKGDSLTILNSSHGTPWTEAGLNTAFQKAKRAAKIKGLRFHDLRGTAATNFVRAGLDLGDVATILGWSKGQVEQIATRYITSEVIAMALVEKLARNAQGTKAVNRGVNRASSRKPKGP